MPTILHHLFVYMHFMTKFWPMLPVACFIAWHHMEIGQELRNARNARRMYKYAQSFGPM